MLNDMTRNDAGCAAGRSSASEVAMAVNTAPKLTERMNTILSMTASYTSRADQNAPPASM